VPRGVKIVKMFSSIMISWLIKGGGAYTTFMHPLAIRLAEFHAGGFDELAGGGRGSSGEGRIFRGGSCAMGTSYGILRVSHTTSTYSFSLARLSPSSFPFSIPNGMMADETKATDQCPQFVYWPHQRMPSTVLLPPSCAPNGSCKTKTNPFAMADPPAKLVSVASILDLLTIKNCFVYDHRISLWLTDTFIRAAEKFILSKPINPIAGYSVLAGYMTLSGVPMSFICGYSELGTDEEGGTIFERAVRYYLNDLIPLNLKFTITEPLLFQT
jgi:hypothetical protein